MNKGIKVLVNASTFFAPILVPAIVFFVVRDDEVKNLSIQVIVFHLIMGLLISISAFFSWFLIGIPFLIIFTLISVIAPIIGIIRALQGRSFQYPIIGSWFS